MEYSSLEVQDNENGDATDSSLLETSPMYASESFNKTLITSICPFPSIYDLDDPAYKDHTQKEQTWNSVADQTNTPVSECKRRWRNLRDVYIRIRKKLDSGQLKQTTWAYYTMLHTFLHDKIKINVDGVNEPLLDGSLTTNEHTENGLSMDSTRKGSLPKPATKRNQKRTANSMFPKKSNKKRCTAASGNGNNARLGLGFNIPGVQNYQSSSQLWAQSIGLRMDGLSVHQQAQIRVRVETLLMEAEMKQAGTHVEHETWKIETDDGHVTDLRPDQFVSRPEDQGPIRDSGVSNGRQGELTADIVKVHLA